MVIGVLEFKRGVRVFFLGFKKEEIVGEKEKGVSYKTSEFVRLVSEEESYKENEVFKEKSVEE